MPSLVDHIDRFVYTVQSIQSTSKQIACNPKGPFVRAALETPLWNLARDVDESELGLFTLVSNSSTLPAGPNDDNDINVAQKTELTRVEFLGATPLRKPVGARKVEEKEPEVYAEAALKYLDKLCVRLWFIQLSITNVMKPDCPAISKRSQRNRRAPRSPGHSTGGDRCFERCSRTGSPYFFTLFVTQP